MEEKEVCIRKECKGAILQPKTIDGRPYLVCPNCDYKCTKIKEER